MDKKKAQTISRLRLASPTKESQKVYIVPTVPGKSKAHRGCDAMSQKKVRPPAEEGNYADYTTVDPIVSTVNGRN